jgi:hypothetical protein
MNRPERCERSLASRFALRHIADVGFDRKRLPTEGTNVSSGLIQTLDVAAEQNHVRARIGTGQRHLAPQPTAAAGNQQPLAIQTKPIEYRHDETLT